MNKDLSISIINTNNRNMVLECLDSIFKTTEGINLEIIVVNNACMDGSTQAIHKRFPQVNILVNESMLGFSTNNNLAFSQASGSYLMLLNDDTLVKPNAFKLMVEFMDNNPEAAVVGAKLFNPDGSTQLSYDFSPNPIYDGLRPLSEFLLPVPKSNDKPLEVDNVSGACMMVRASAVNDIGLLDTSFDPIYSEEVDWCFRFKKAGWKIFHLPSAKVIHRGGATMERNSLGRYERIYEKKGLFFKKHYGKGALTTYKAILMFSNLGKTLSWLILWSLNTDGAREEVKTHWNLVHRIPMLLKDS